MATLKHELKAKGVHYRDIAARLRVSEGTVKRYFSGKGVSLTVLRRLAEIADLDFLALATLAEKQGAAERKFTKTHQAALGRSKFLSTIYFLLWHGWTPTQIGAEFDLTVELDNALGTLESLGLIRRLSHEVKILATPNLDEKGGGLLADLTRENASLFLARIDLQDPQCDWTCSSARLSRASVIQFREMISKFVEDTRALMINDTALPRDETQWYRVFIGARPVSRRQYLQQD